MLNIWKNVNKIESLKKIRLEDLSIFSTTWFVSDFFLFLAVSEFDPIFIIFRIFNLIAETSGDEIIIEEKASSTAKGTVL